MTASTEISPPTVENRFATLQVVGVAKTPSIILSAHSSSSSVLGVYETV